MSNFDARVSTAEGRSPRARRMDELGMAIDEIAAVNRELAMAAARRAVLVEKARLLSEADAAANLVEAQAAGRRPQSQTGWTFEAAAWRELVSEIACALHIPERSAQTLVAHSRFLVSRLPATLGALGAGEISYRHAQKLIDHAETLPLEALATFEDLALPHARGLTAAKFDRKARIIRERAHPESIAERTKSACELRDVILDPARDGMAYLSAYLPAAVAVAGFARIDAIATSLNDPDEPRTQGQLRADVFGDLMIDGMTDPITFSGSADTPIDFSEEDIPELTDRHLAELEQMGIEGSYEQIAADLRNDLDRRFAERARTIASSDGVGRGIAATVAVIVPALAILNRSEEPATLEGYGPIDPDTARELAASAPSFTRILTHPETGTVLSVGRDSYSVPSDLKRLLRLRDDTCRHPGCSRRARRCDIDHTVDWLHGGATSHDNLAHLCRAHHSLKHNTRWQYEHLDDSGTLAFTSPTGHRYLTHPSTPIARSPTAQQARPEFG